MPKSQLVYQAQPTTTKPTNKIRTHAHKLDAKDIAGQVPRPKRSSSNTEINEKGELPENTHIVLCKTLMT